MPVLKLPLPYNSKLTWWGDGAVDGVDNGVDDGGNDGGNDGVDDGGNDVKDTWSLVMIAVAFLLPDVLLNVPKMLMICWCWKI